MARMRLIHTKAASTLTGVIALTAACSPGAGNGSARLADEVTAMPALEAPASRTRVVDLDAPRPNDRGERRSFTLDNGLEVLLISDESYQKSAAALDVAVGSLEDPWEHLGMAHFLEHMLFLGTEKYPDVDEYSQYISNHQGSDNAYTAGESTNYQFQVAHEGLRGALDRFAQFFVAPLFTPEFVEREMNAVNSEHQKNLQDDFWRMRMVKRLLHRDGHPRQKFSTGSLETLQNTTREELMAFHRKYYSANQMKLVVLGQAGLDDMESWVREYYAAIPNYDVKRPEYDSNVFDEAALPQLVQIKPVTDQRQLQIEFAAPSNDPYYETHPLRLFGSLVGHEGEGSLLSQLKREGLATSLSAGGGETTAYASYPSATITLTEKGRKDIDRVIELFFSYLDMLRREGLKEYYFEDEQAVADLNYFYRDHQEGMWAASSYAASMQTYPALEFEKRQALIERYGPEDFQLFLSYMKPERMRAILSAPDVETTELEPHYGTEYSVAKLPKERVASWKNPERLEAIHYPAPNPFIPDDLTILSSDVREEPYALIDDQRGEFWFQQDNMFDLPKAQVSLLIMSDEVNASLRSRLIATLYTRSINEGLNEWRYPVREAGLFATVDDESRGIRLSFNGYSQKIPELMKEFAARLENVTIDEQTFAALRDDLDREYKNVDYDQAYMQTFYEYNYLMSPSALHRRDYRSLIGDITLDDVKAFAGRVLSACAIEGVAYGNLKPEQMRESVDAVFDTVAESVLEPAKRLEPRMLSIPSGEEYAWVFHTKTDNNCWMKMLQLGPRDHRTEAIARVAENYLDTRFYSELRTRQQLGYVVWSGSTLSNDGQGLFFLIQSGTHDAMDIEGRAETYLTDALPAIRDLGDEEFSTMKQSIITELREADTDMAERTSRIEYEALNLGGQFDWRESVVAEIEKLTKEDVAAALDAAIAADGIASIEIFLDADGKEPSTPDETRIEDGTTFKTSLPLFPRTADRTQL